jgi:hypothetical protein
VTVCVRNDVICRRGKRTEVVRTSLTFLERKSGKLNRKRRAAFGNTIAQVPNSSHKNGNAKYFPRSRLCPRERVFAERDRRAAWLDRTGLRLRHGTGWRDGCSLSRALASTLL